MKKLFRLSRWHRWIGISVAVFAVLLAVSGFLLNHTEDLRLDERYIQNGLLLDWYGIKPQEPPVSYAAGPHWATRVDGQLYFDEQRIAENVTRLVGAVAMPEFNVVAVDQELYLLLDDGSVLEKLSDVEGVPAGMRAIGLDSEGQLVIRAAHDLYQADLNALRWTHAETDAIRWSKTTSAPAPHINAVLEQYRGIGLSYERVLLDMHSGRLFGQGGVWVFDVVALLFIVLAITGGVMWWRGY